MGKTLAFEWNGVDTSQFDVANMWFDSVFTYISAATLTAPASGRESPFRKQLTWTQTANLGGGRGYCVLLAKDPLPSHNLLFELFVENQFQNGLGLALFADYDGVSDVQTTLSCFCTTFIGTERQWRIDDGFTAGEGSFIQGRALIANRRGLVSVRLYGDQPAAGSESGLPAGTMHATGLLVNGNSAGSVIGFQDFPADPPGAPWPLPTALKWGLCFYAPGGVFVGPARFTGLRIYDMT